LTVGVRGQGRGKKCVFPFKYKEIQYHSCTPEDHRNLWCATKVDGEGKFVKGEWGDCSWSPQCIRQDVLCRTTQPNSSDSGPSCVFPFKYGGQEFKTCIWGPKGFWCATAVDNEGEMTEWANCEKTDYCYNPWKTVGWAGIPQVNIDTLGNQVKHKLDEHVEKCQDELGFFAQIGRLFPRIGNKIQLLFCSSGKKAPAPQEEKKSADSIQGKSETVQGEPVPLSLHWKCVMISTASLGVVFLGAEIWAVGRALRRPPQRPNTNIDEQNERCWLMSDVGC